MGWSFTDKNMNTRNCDDWWFSECTQFTHKLDWWKTDDLVIAFRLKVLTKSVHDFSGKSTLTKQSLKVLKSDPNYIYKSQTLLNQKPWPNITSNIWAKSLDLLSRLFQFEFWRVSMQHFWLALNPFNQHLCVAAISVAISAPDVPLNYLITDILYQLSTEMHEKCA